MVAWMSLLLSCYLHLKWHQNCFTWVHKSCKMVLDKDAVKRKWNIIVVKLNRATLNCDCFTKIIIKKKTICKNYTYKIIHLSKLKTLDFVISSNTSGKWSKSIRNSNKIKFWIYKKYNEIRENKNAFLPNLATVRSVPISRVANGHCRMLTLPTR